MFADNALLNHERNVDALQVGVKDRSEDERKLCVRVKMMGVALLKRGKVNYEKLIQAIRDQHAFGVDVYPKMLHDAYELLESHSAAGNGTSNGNPRTHRGRGRGSEGRGRDRGRRVRTSGFQFAQEDKLMAGTDGRVVDRITCFRYQRKGHFVDMCPNTEIGASHNIIADEIEIIEPEDTESAVGSTHDENEIIECNNNEWVNSQEVNDEVEDEDTSDDDSLVVAFQYMGLAANLANSGKYSDTDILLDTGSTMSVFKNKKMLLNVRKSRRVLRAYSNSGFQDSNTVGDFPGIFTV